MTRAEIIAQRMTELRAAVANDDPYLSMCGTVNVVFAAMATPGCEAQGVRLVDLPRLAERVAEMADAHEALRIEHAAWGAIIDATRADRDALRVRVAELTDPDNRLRAMLDWRGVDVPCATCTGSGRRGYANTTTWRGGAGGQAMTDDVCDACWGSGDAERPGVDLRELTRLNASILKAADAARKAERADVVAHLRTGGRVAGDHADAIEAGEHEGAAGGS